LAPKHRLAEYVLIIVCHI